jgi:hypothetical protein
MTTAEPAPPYAEVEETVATPSRQQLIARRILYPPVTPSRQRKRPSPISIPGTTTDQDAKEKKTPFQPQLSSPLARVSFATDVSPVDDDDFGFGTLKADLFPPNPLVQKAYKGLDVSMVDAQAEHLSSVLAEGPDAYESINNASSPTGLAEVNSSRMTLGVRIGTSGSACISGDVIRITEDGCSAIASGPNASAMAAKPLEGIVAAAYFVNGQAHAEWSKQAPNSSTGVLSPPKPGRKRRHTGSGQSTSPHMIAETPKPSVQRTYGKKIRGDSTSASGSSASQPRVSSAGPASTAIHPPMLSTAEEGVALALLPASAKDISHASINNKTLKGTALENVSEEILSKLSAWGKGLTELIGLAIHIEALVLLPSKALAVQDKRRPEPIGLFGKNYRKFTDGVFKKFKPNYGTQLWSWWSLLSKNMREIVGEGDSAHPGAILDDADWSPLLVRGNKGIWIVVVAVVLWRKHMERTPSALAQDLHSWAEFVVDVIRVFKVLIEVSPKTSAQRKKRRVH